jgi:hypothetical protein
MRHPIQVLTATLVVLAFAATPALAEFVEFALGAYGGVNVPLSSDAGVGSVIGAKVRVVPPIPMIGFEAWYAHFGSEDPGDLDEGDLSLALDAEGFNMWGADVLIGSVRGIAGFKWYGVVGVNAAELKELGGSETTHKFGGELGFGLEITPPFLGVGVEGRGMLLFPDLSGDFSERLLTLTVGVNYHF